MSTKRKKRITKQVRIERKLHKRLKIIAFEEELTLSKLMGLIIKNYLRFRK